MSTHIPTWNDRCDIHPDHSGIVTSRMIQDRVQEEIDDLRAALSAAVPCDRNAVLDEVADTLELLVANATDWDSTRWDQGVMRCVNAVWSLKLKPAAPQPLIDDKSMERDAVLEEAALAVENMIVAGTWAGSTGTYYRGGKVAEKLRSMKSTAAAKGVDKP